MKTTYTIKTTMPWPTVGIKPVSASILVSYELDKDMAVQLDTSKTKQWLDDVTALCNHPSVLFASMIDGTFHISLSDKDAAEIFEEKWGAAA